MIFNRKQGILHLCYYRTWISVLDVVSLFIPNIKYACRYMNKLKNDGLIQIVRVPMFDKKGKGHNFYSLTRNGFKEISGTAKGYKTPVIPTSTHLLHHFIINTFLTGVKSLEKQFPELITSSMSEKELKLNNEFYSFIYENVDDPDKFIKIIPDFVISIGNKNNRKLFLGEVDTCTETVKSASFSSKSIENKFKILKQYMEYKIIKFFSSLYNYNYVNFSYLHITTGNLSRIKYINNVAKKILSDEIDLYIGNSDDLIPNLEDEVSYSSLISPIWYKVDIPFSEQKVSILL